MEDFSLENCSDNSKNVDLIFFSFHKSLYYLLSVISNYTKKGETWAT